MGRLTDERRAEIRASQDKRLRRIRAQRLDADPKDAEVDVEFRSPSLSFTISTDEFDCPHCNTGTAECVALSTSRNLVRKTWRCRFCRWVMSGQYTTYIIQEEPWRP